MKVQIQTSYYKALAAKGLKYFSLFLIGIAIIFLCSLVQQFPALHKGETYYTSFFLGNFTLLAKILFVIIAFLAGYIYRLTPWLVGVSLILIFPLTSVVEAIVYTGSHNLIPIEFAYHFWLALPSIVAAFIGKLIYSRIAKQKSKTTLVN